MKNLYLILTIAALSNIGLISAQTPLPYYTGFEQNTPAWTQLRKGAISNYSWTVSTFNAYAGTACLMHNYPVNGSSQTMNWYISPPFDFSTGGRIDSLRYAFSGFGTPAVNDTVAIFLLSGTADPSTAQKTQLIEFRGSNYNNDNTYRLLSNVTIPAMPGQSRLAFKYSTTINWLDVRFDNLALSCNAPPSPTNTTGAAELTKCAGETTTLTASASGTIAWFNSTQTTVVSTGSAFVTPTLAAGTHTFYAETRACTNSATRTAIQVSVSPCLGIITESDHALNFYPNPANHFLAFQKPLSNPISIINLMGKEVMHVSQENISEIDISGLPEGVYFLKFILQGQTFCKRFIKTKE